MVCGTLNPLRVRSEPTSPCLKGRLHTATTKHSGLRSKPTIANKRLRLKRSRRPKNKDANVVSIRKKGRAATRKEVIS